MTSARDQIVESLADKEYRDLFVSEHIGQGLAFQIRALRKERGWSQDELGQRAEMKQASISQLEDPDYGRLSLSTLKRLASAFDVALMVKFAPFSELVEWTTELTPRDLAPPSFGQEHQVRRALSVASASGPFMVTTAINVPIASGGVVSAFSTLPLQGLNLESIIMEGAAIQIVPVKTGEEKKALATAA